MLTRKRVVLPAIDLLGGRVVRLHQGRYDEVTEFARDPVELAREFAAAGAGWLHVIDLDAARTGERSPAHRAVIEQIAAVAGLRLQLGGGLRSRAHVEWALELGVSRVLIGSYAVEAPQEVGRIAAETGAVAVAVDCREGTVRTHGWERDSAIAAEEFVRTLAGHGVADIFATAIGRDGTGLGADLELVGRLRPHVQGQLIAAGGIGSVRDIREALDAGADAVVVGRALLEGSVTLEDALAVT